MTQLPHGFRQIRMELAREKGHPDGARNHGYSFVAPLDSAGRLDAAEGAKHPEGRRFLLRILRQAFLKLYSCFYLVFKSCF